MDASAAKICAADLAPFHESKSVRDEQTRRTEHLVSAGSNTGHASSDTTSAAAVVIRPLTKREIATLEGPDCRCQCSDGESDWSQIRVMYVGSSTDEGARDLCTELQQQVVDTTFGGWVLIGIVLISNDGKTSSSIRRNGMISNTLLEPGCVVEGNTVIDQTHVCSGGSIVDCGTVTSENGTDSSSSPSSFADEMEITLGAESGGGRNVKVHVESTMIDVCHKLGMGSQSTSSSKFHYQAYRPTQLVMNTVCTDAAVRHTPKLCNVYVSSNASIDAATSVTNAILLPESSIDKSCTVDNAYLQWKAEITTNSSVSSTIVMECAAIGPNSFVSNTVLGPDSHLSTGECHCSLIGPNTNSHHQSLIISVLWPLGRGNVGYGSNLGSNHTGRLPDQEVGSGEGTFWGLGCVIKMPVNLCDAPYSIVAAGVQLSPQRLAMPFSLVLNGSEKDGCDGMNQVIPGWLLQSSPYTIARSEAKFAKRRKAKRHGFYTGWTIIRENTIEMCYNARQELLKAGQSQASGQASGEMKKATVFKTDRSIPGLGQNYLTESGRKKGIQAYTNIIHLYALRGLLLKAETALDMCRKSFGKTVAPRELDHRLEGIISIHQSENGLLSSTLNGGDGGALWPALPWNEVDERHHLWNFQRNILKKEIPSILNDVNSGNLTPSEIVLHLLDRLVVLEKDFAQRVFKSKQRDDARGKSTIPGYAENHVRAEDDAVVKDALEESRRVESSVADIKHALSGRTRHVVSRL